MLASRGSLRGECSHRGARCAGLYVDAFYMVADRVDVTSIDLETGEVYDTLIEVTEEMIAHWTDLGFCP